MTVAPGTPFAGFTSSWPSLGKIHLAASRMVPGRRLVAVCGRTFRDTAQTYEAGVWDLLGPVDDLEDTYRCLDCVRKSVDAH